METETTQTSRPGGIADGPPTASWVESSDAYVWPVLKMLGRFEPEELSRLGDAEVDEEILRLPPDRAQQRIAAYEATIGELRRAGAEENHFVDHPFRLRLDLELMIGWLELESELLRREDALLVPCLNPASMVYMGLAHLLHQQTAEQRRPAALVRLMRYAGLEPGYPPLAEQAAACIRARLHRPGLTFPNQADVEGVLAQGRHFLEEIPKLFEHCHIRGYEKAYGALREQIDVYESFLRHQLLPRCREHFRLPPEVYAMRLRHGGVDMPVEELTSRARVAFRELPGEIANMARIVAAKRRFDVTDAASVIRRLDDERLGEEIAAFYRQRLRELERRSAREGFATPPAQGPRVRLATPAELAQYRRPHLRGPRVIGNAGERWELVLPAQSPAAAGAEEPARGPWFSPAGSWLVAAHEGFPGHGLQYGFMIDSGVSLARRIFGYSTATVEGWAVYAESEALPWLPEESRLLGLRQRLLRATRSFFDPGLQEGRYTPGQVSRSLRHQLGISAADAAREVDRCTLRVPGMATCYFCGYCRYVDLRAAVEFALGPAFDRRRYHDFVLAQGLVPPALLRKQVLEEFVPQERQPLAA